jgi:hypothetical protein
LAIVKSNILPDKFAYLTMVKNTEQNQKNLNATKNIFELADGLGISLQKAAHFLTCLKVQICEKAIKFEKNHK